MPFSHQHQAAPLANDCWSSIYALIQNTGPMLIILCVCMYVMMDAGPLRAKIIKQDFYYSIIINRRGKERRHQLDIPVFFTTSIISNVIVSS